jgi:hypothetical protein
MLNDEQTADECTEGREEYPPISDSLAPQVGVLYNFRGDEIPIYKITLELHLDREGLRALQDSNTDCITEEPQPCGEGKWAQNGRIVDAQALRAFLDSAESYCTVWSCNPENAND